MTRKTQDKTRTRLALPALIAMVLAIIAGLGVATADAFAVGMPDRWGTGFIIDEYDTHTIAYNQVHPEWGSPSDVTDPGVITVSKDELDSNGGYTPWEGVSSDPSWIFEGQTRYLDNGAYYGWPVNDVEYIAYALYANYYYDWFQTPAETSITASTSQAGESGTLKYRIFGDPNAPDFSSVGGYDYSSVMSGYETVSWEIGSASPEFLSKKYVYDESGIPYSIRFTISTVPTLRGTGSTTYDEFWFSTAIVNVYVEPCQPLAYYTDGAGNGAQGDVAYVDLNVLFNMPRPDDAGDAITRTTRTVGETYTVDGPAKVSSDGNWVFSGWWTQSSSYDGGQNKSAKRGYTDVPADYDPSDYINYITTERHLNGSVLEDAYTENLVFTGYWVYVPDEITIHKTDSEGNPIENAVFYLSEMDVEGGYVRFYGDIDALNNVALLTGGYAKTDADGNVSIRYDSETNINLVVFESLPPEGYGYEKITDMDNPYYQDYVLHHEIDTQTMIDYTIVYDPTNLEYGNAAAVTTSIADTKTINIVDPKAEIRVLKLGTDGLPIPDVGFKIEYYTSSYSENGGDVRGVAKNAKSADTSYSYETTTGEDGIAHLAVSPIDMNLDYSDFVIYKITETSVPTDAAYEVIPEEKSWYVMAQFRGMAGGLTYMVIQPSDVSHTANFDDAGNMSELMNLTAADAQEKYDLDISWGSYCTEGVVFIPGAEWIETELEYDSYLNVSASWDTPYYSGVAPDGAGSMAAHTFAVSGEFVDFGWSSYRSFNEPDLTPAAGYYAKSTGYIGNEEVDISDMLPKYPLEKAPVTSGADFTVLNDLNATLSYEWEGPVPPDAANLLPASITAPVGSDLTDQLAGDVSSTDPHYKFKGWRATASEVSNLPRGGTVVYGTWEYVSDLGVVLKDTAGTPIANTHFTVSATGVDGSFTSTTDSTGRLSNMDEAVPYILAGATSIRITQTDAVGNYIKPAGVWTITPNKNAETGAIDSYTISYTAGTGDSLMSYIEGATTGTEFVILNGIKTATLSYQWAVGSPVPADAVLPQSQTAVVGTDMSDRIADDPTTTDGSYLFMGWEYDAAAVSSLPEEGVVVYGSWRHVSDLSVVLHDTEGQILANGQFTVATNGSRATYNTTSAADGSLDMAPAIAAVLNGSTQITITENAAPTDYITPTGTWTITPSADLSSYSIAYTRGTDDNAEMEYIEGATTGNAFILVNERAKATMSYQWKSGSPVPADAVLPASVSDYVGTDMTSQIAGAPTTADGSYLFLGWEYDADKVSSLPADGVVVTGSWKKVDALTVCLQDTTGTVLENGSFTVKAVGASGSYDTQSDASGMLDMSGAIPFFLNGATAIEITETAAPEFYVKPLGKWTITANADASSYEIAYAKGTGDNAEMSYVAGSTSGKAFIVVNERVKATLSYQWKSGSPVPADAVLPASVSDYVGADMTSRIASDPVTSDDSYLFLGWDYDTAAVSSLPKEGTVVYGSWAYAPDLSVVLHDTSGQAISGSEFTVTPIGGTRADASYTTTSNSTGALDMAPAMPYVLNGASKIKITQNTKTDPYIKATGTWTITVPWNAKGAADYTYNIDYDFGASDTLTSYIEGPVIGTSFIILNATQKATVSYAWEPGSPVPADAVLPDSFTDYVGSNVSNKIAGWQTSSDPSYIFMGWSLPDGIYNLPPEGVVISGSWIHVSDLEIVKKSETGETLSGATFTVTCNYGEKLRGALKASGGRPESYTTTTASDGKLDMGQAMEAFVDYGAVSITIVETQPAANHIKAAGFWTITPEPDFSAYHIAYTAGSGDTLESYISGASTGTSLALLNEKAKATLSYEWASDSPVPEDAVLPESVTDYVGTDMTSRLAGPQSSADGNYLFLGWEYDEAAVSSLPEQGTVVYGVWDYVGDLSIRLVSSAGKPLMGAKFNLLITGLEGGDVTQTVVTDEDGILDTSAILEAFLAGAESCVITEAESADGYLKGNGTWTITRAETVGNYNIVYESAEGDITEFEYISGETTGHYFTLVNTALPEPEPEPAAEPEPEPAPAPAPEPKKDDSGLADDMVKPAPQPEPAKIISTGDPIVVVVGVFAAAALISIVLSWRRMKKK